MTNSEKDEKLAEYIWFGAKVKVQIIKTEEELVRKLHELNGVTEFDQEKVKTFFESYSCLIVLGELPAGWPERMISMPYMVVDCFVESEKRYGSEIILKTTKKFFMGEK